MLKNSLLTQKQKPSFSMEGRYRFVVRNAFTHDIVRETDWVDNLILDAGLNRIGTNSVSMITGIAIGTGTVAPAVTDTGLGALSAWTTTLAPGVAASNSGSPNYITTTTFGYRFVAGVLNGNYTEVGAGWGSTTMFSRALILDGGGSPTTITVGLTEYLDVYYQVRLVPDLTTYTTSVTIGGVSYSTQRRPAGVSSATGWKFANYSMLLFQSIIGVTSYPLQAYSGTLGAVTSTPSGTLANGGGSPVPAAYVNNSYERSATLSVGLNECNVPGGIKSIVIGTNWSGYQYEFDSVIPKDDTKVMTLTAKATWGRV